MSLIYSFDPKISSPPIYAAKSFTNRSIAVGLGFVAALFWVAFLAAEGFGGEVDVIVVVVVVDVGWRTDLVVVLFFVVGTSGFWCENMLLKLSALPSLEVALGV